MHPSTTPICSSEWLPEERLKLVAFMVLWGMEQVKYDTLNPQDVFHLLDTIRILATSQPEFLEAFREFIEYIR